MSNPQSPIGTLKKKKKGLLVKQGLEELISSLSELTHINNSSSGNHSNSSSNSNSIANSTSNSNSNLTTPSLSPHCTVTLPMFPITSNNSTTSSNNSNQLSTSPSSSTTTSPSSSKRSSSVVSGGDPTRSLAKFYLLAQQLEYVGDQTYGSPKPDPNQLNPLIPVENISAILNVQWTTYWTIPLLPTTTCLDIIKYISLKTNREIDQLKVADSDGKLVDHDTNLTQFRCKKFLVFEDISVDKLNSGFQSRPQPSTSSFLVSSPSVSTPSSPGSPGSSTNHPGLSNLTEINLNQSDSTRSTPLQLSPTIQRKSHGPPPTVPPRSPQSFAVNQNLFNVQGGAGSGTPGSTNILLHNVEIISEPSSHHNQTPSTTSSPISSPSSSRKNSNQQQGHPASIEQHKSQYIYYESTPLSSSGNKSSSSSSTAAAENEKYCKFLENVQISQTLPTTEKGKILDNYFNHYYQELFKYIHTRNRRLQRLEEFFSETQLDEAGRARWKLKHFAQETNYLRNKRAGMKLQEFKILTQIGKGGFGQVFLAKKIDSGDIVTLKRIKKSSYEWANQRIQVSQEKNLMLVHDCKWITKLLYSFQDSNYLYLAMEYHCGGDFRALLNSLGMLSEDEARFYMIEMIEAVQSLHSMKYTHRDIKPSNFVIDKDGHIRLIDFGLSKEGIEKRNGFTAETMSEFRKSCINAIPAIRRNTIGNGMTAYRRPTAHSAVGSPEYMAPEIVNDEGYDHTTDWWSLGCVFMEMLCGFNPFCADTPSDVFVNIIQWKEVLEWDLFCQDLSAEAADVLKRLLCEPAQRLGANGIEEFKSHPFFQGHWEDIDKLKPPFIPKVESDMDTSYFEDAVNNDPNTWEIESDSSERKNPFNNLNIPFFTYRKSTPLGLKYDEI